MEREIAKVLGTNSALDIPEVRRVYERERAKSEARKEIEERAKMRELKLETIKKLYESGVRVRDIGEQLGIDASTVCRYATKLGLEKRGPGRWKKEKTVPMIATTKPIRVREHFRSERGSSEKTKLEESVLFFVKEVQEQGRIDRVASFLVGGLFVGTVAVLIHFIK